MTERQALDDKLALVRSGLLEMAVLVEQAVALALQSLSSPTAEARTQAKVIDQQLDDKEVEVVERCHDIMGLESPLASDLRLTISAICMATDLEQIGDLAEGIAKRCAVVARGSPLEMPPSLSALAAHIASMVREAVESFAHGGTERIRRVVREEPVCHDLTKRCSTWIQDAMRDNSEQIRSYTQVFRAVYHLEQIADLSVEIATEAVFFHKGLSLRHHLEDL